VDTLGFEEVFKRLSAMGYREVEFAGYNAQGRRWSNAELRALLEKYRLRAAGSHVS
jgi:sugar phosphate isomerase/epimerase